MENMDKKKAIIKQLYVILHSFKCSSDNCGVDNCALIKTIKQHMMSCASGFESMGMIGSNMWSSCGVDHCLSSRQILLHWRFCQRCDVCISAITDVYSTPLRKQSTRPSFENITQLNNGQTVKMSNYQMDSKQTTVDHSPHQPLANFRSGIQRLPNSCLGNDYNKIVNGFNSICLDSSIELDSE